MWCHLCCSLVTSSVSLIRRYINGRSKVLKCQSRKGHERWNPSSFIPPQQTSSCSCDVCVCVYVWVHSDCPFRIIWESQGRRERRKHRDIEKAFPQVILMPLFSCLPTSLILYCPHSTENHSLMQTGFWASLGNKYAIFFTSSLPICLS